MDQPMGNPPPKKSGGALKWILIGCGGIIFLGVAFVGVSVWLVSRAFNTDPAKVEAAAKEIVPFETPAGFKGTFSMSIGFKMAALMAGQSGEGGMIVLMTVPGGKQNEAQMRRQMKENMEKQGKSQEVVEKRKNEKFKVRSQEVEASVDVTSGQGSEERSLQYTLVTENAAGSTVLMMISGPEKKMDHDWVQKFLDTVK